MSSNTNTDIWLAGAFAALTVDLLVYPLDTVKTRIQSPSYTRLYKHTTGITNRPALFRGLYQGVGSIILITIPSSAAFFSTYEALKYALNEYTPPNSTLYLPKPAIHALSSAGAELVSCAILTPAEVLKQNAQVLTEDPSKKGRSTSLEVFKQFRKHPSGLWRGYTALAARNLPFTGLQFPLFEHLKSRLLVRRKRQKGDKRVDGVFERARITAMSAAVAGSGAAWITTPIDVVKTRIMLAAGEDKTMPKMAVAEDHGTSQRVEKASRKSGWEVARGVLRNEGVRGLFRGALLRSVWTAIGSGLYLSCYEAGRFYLEEQRKEAKASEGNHFMGKDLKDIQVGVGRSRSHDVIKKSAWQED